MSEPVDYKALYKDLSSELSDMRIELNALRLGAQLGTVDGDFLADLLADATPDEWRMDAARAFAERILASMVQAGYTVLRGPQSKPWKPLRSAA